MNIKKSVSYKTTDGEEFGSRDEATKHQMYCDSVARLENEASVLINAVPAVKRLIHLMVGDPVPFRDILSAYIKRASIKSNREEMLCS